MDLRTSANVILGAVVVFLFDLALSCDNPVEFVEIEPEQYDMTYSSIGTSGARPLGFDGSNIVYFNNPDESNPCVSITGVEGRHIEIMFETVPNAVLCFRDHTGDSRCAQGRYRECSPAVEDTMTFEFYCDQGQGCSESDITFWLRITKGDATDNEGMWCHWRDNQFPESLFVIPPDFEIPDNTGDNDVTDGANTLPSCGLITLTILSLSTSLLHRFR